MKKRRLMAAAMAAVMLTGTLAVPQRAKQAAQRRQKGKLAPARPRQRRRWKAAS